jgi:predicted MFS family arabinose efflux permease
MPVSYLGELRQNVRPLAAAALGCGSGLMLMAYITTIFGPYLVEAFQWSRSQFALIGLSMFTTLASLPFIGRITDRYGVRAAASVGAVGVPLCLLGYSLMTGSFAVYFLISCTILAVGSFTSPIVYTRLVAADFKQARGLALTIVTIAPAIIGAIAAPLVTEINELYGWRIGYRVLAAFMLLGGVTALFLIPPHDRAARQASREAMRPARTDFRIILSSRTFWIIAVAMLLCLLQTPLHASQMGMMLRDNSLGAATAAAMISVYGVGTVLGRIACGLALDKFSAPVVAFVSMILPALGYALLATPIDTTLVIGFSMLLVGITVGAEGDLMSFLVARHFKLNIFSTTLSLVYFSVYLAGATGSLGISLTLKLTDSFAPYLALMAVMIFVGSFLFLLLPKDGQFEKIG